MISVACAARIWRRCYNRATVGNLVLIAFLGRGKRNVAVVGLALLLSCCTNQSETKSLLLGSPWEDDTGADRDIFACRQYGFYPGTQQL